MSANPASPPQRMTVPKILARKNGTPIVALTAYHSSTARIVDRHVDIILVGDSLGMVAHGMETTLAVPLELMVYHGKAVVRSTARALVVVDMPFGTYEESPEVAFRNAARIMAQTGCGAVKLEGGAHMAPTIRFLTRRGIPVMAHTGLTPQSCNTLGGFRTQGRSRESWPGHEADALAVSEAGAFAVVLEGMVEPLAEKITALVPVPTIGIGASASCDGQILVLEDMLGMGDSPPRFVRQYASLADEMDKAIDSYAQDVRARKFPGPENLY